MSVFLNTGLISFFSGFTCGFGVLTSIFGLSVFLNTGLTSFFSGFTCGFGVLTSVLVCSVFLNTGLISFFSGFTCGFGVLTSVLVCSVFSTQFFFFKEILDIENSAKQVLANKVKHIKVNKYFFIPKLYAKFFSKSSNEKLEIIKKVCDNDINVSFTDYSLVLTPF